MKKIPKLYENYLIQRNRGKFKLIITRKIKCCRRWRRKNSVRILGYYEVFNLNKLQMSFLWFSKKTRTSKQTNKQQPKPNTPPKKKPLKNLYNFILARQNQIFASYFPFIIHIFLP